MIAENVLGSCEGVHADAKVPRMSHVVLVKGANWRRKLEISGAE